MSKKPPEKVKLSDPIIKRITPPDRGTTIMWDSELTGFGLRVTEGGTKAFILNYSISGRERRYTIGRFPAWRTTTARDKAAEQVRRIADGKDPLGDRQAAREAPTIAKLCALYEEHHLPSKRPASQSDDRRNIARFILPEWKHRKVADLEDLDVQALHRKISKTAPVTANRVLALVSKMFTLAIKWKLRPDRINPAHGIDKNPEIQRKVYLKVPEFERLFAALAAHEDQQAANILRVLILTGCRRGEALAMRWDGLDLKEGVWVKPSSLTKQKTEHSVPISPPVRLLLSELKEASPLDGPGAEWVFPGDGKTGHRVDLKRDWKLLRKAAGIPDVRMHDLRHSYASLLVSSGYSLPLIGSLLGHNEVATTQRYAHLMDSAQREATGKVGTFFENLGKAPPDNVVPIKSGR